MRMIAPPDTLSPVTLVRPAHHPCTYLLFFFLKRSNLNLKRLP